MKFRAVLHDQQLMKEFLNAVLTLSKLTKECVMNISADKLIFIINEESSSSAPLVWAEIKSNIYFDTYTMEGVDAEHANIYLAFNPANLARSLAVISRGSVTYVKIKLTNKQFPCLTVDIQLPSANNVQNRQIVHDVPVDMIPRRDWGAYKMPHVPESQIVLTMPSLRFLRNLIDKIKNLSPSITFYANTNGELSIVAETDQATVASHYRNLEVKKVHYDENSENCGNRANTEKGMEVACLVDCKKTAVFLSALQINNLVMSCGIVQDHLIQMELEIRLGMVLHCIIPAVCV